MKKLLVSVALSLGLAAPFVSGMLAVTPANAVTLGPDNYICINSSGQIVSGATPSTPGVTCRPVNFQPSQGGGKVLTGGPDRADQCAGIADTLNYFQCLTYQGPISVR